jgi:hypothetical protein
MAEDLNLMARDIPAALDTALERGRQVTLAYVDENDHPVASYRGSVHVHSPTQLAIWVRNPDSGLTRSIVDRPNVHLIYYGAGEGPGPIFLGFKGSAHTEPSENDTVYGASAERERNADPERNGVAVIVDVESVRGFADGTPFEMAA